MYDTSKNLTWQQNCYKAEENTVNPSRIKCSHFLAEPRPTSCLTDSLSPPVLQEKPLCTCTTGPDTLQAECPSCHPVNNDSHQPCRWLNNLRWMEKVLKDKSCPSGLVHLVTLGDKKPYFNRNFNRQKWTWAHNHKPSNPCLTVC